LPVQNVRFVAIYDLQLSGGYGTIDPTTKHKKGKIKVFYYELKFANGERTVVLSAGDPVDEIPAEFQGDVVNVETICEVSPYREVSV